MGEKKEKGKSTFKSDRITGGGQERRFHFSLDWLRGLNRGRLPRRIESHLDFHREILDVGSEIFSLSFSSLGGMRTAFLSAPVIVRDLYDTVQSSSRFSRLSD